MLRWMLLVMTAGLLVFGANARACDTCGGKKQVVLLQGMSDHHHPVTTRSVTAQKFFDQGIKMMYGFNHEEAIKSFRRAAELDLNLAMAHWGMALALGSNYNLEADAQGRELAYAALQKAIALSPRASTAERDYINALAKRYSSDPTADVKQLAIDYKNAMGELARAYPDDLDAATLYAESAMNLRPWKLWGLDGKPAEGTEEIIATIEGVLKRDPNHIGANHLYIHAVEASPHPERAIGAANRLAKLAPNSGHLVHMPSHTYLRMGDYAAAARVNWDAATVDRAYVQANGEMGVYPMMYYNHNLHFLAVAQAMRGRYADAKKAADLLAKRSAPAAKQVAPLEFFVPTPTFIMLRFGRWDDIMRAPAPDANLPTTRALWHFSRAMAAAANGKGSAAQSEKRFFESYRDRVAAETLWDQNIAGDVLKVATHVLDAKLALAQKDRTTAIEHLQKAIAIEDTMKYSEPAAWYLPSRETLGRVLLQNGDARAAEEVFRADLVRNPRNPRSLFGLAEALQAQGQVYAAKLIRRQFQIGWQNADSKLTLQNL